MEQWDHFLTLDLDYRSMVQLLYFYLISGNLLLYIFFSQKILGLFRFYSLCFLEVGWLRVH